MPPRMDLRRLHLAWHKPVKDEVVPVFIVVSGEAGDLPQIELRVQVLQRARIELVPRRVPRRLVAPNPVRKSESAKIVADRGKPGDHRDIAAADRQ